MFNPIDIHIILIGCQRAHDYRINLEIRNKYIFNVKFIMVHIIKYEMKIFKPLDGLKHLFQEIF